jgi:hypothetical protein
VLDVDRYGLGRVKLELIDVFLTRLGRYFRQDSSLHNLCLGLHPDLSDRQEVFLFLSKLAELLFDVHEQFLGLKLPHNSTVAQMFFDSWVTLVNFERLPDDILILRGEFLSCIDLVLCFKINGLNALRLIKGLFLAPMKALYLLKPDPSLLIIEWLFGFCCNLVGNCDYFSV